MSKAHRIGLIGLDTSHVEGFTQLLNDPDDPNHVPGGKVVAGFPGGSDDLEVSCSRVEGFTQKLAGDWGVEIMESPEAVAEACDLVIITAVDGRVHRDLFERTAPFGKPTFIDKPFATDVEDAKAILRLADESNVPVMSCSSLRYAENLQASLQENSGEAGNIIGCHAYGPMEIQPPLPPLFWYGTHTVELIVTAMGTGCQRVQVVTNEDNDLLTAEWADGRVASIHGLRNQHCQFGITLHRKESAEFIDISAVKQPWYAGLLEAIIDSLPEGRSAVQNAEMLEIVRIIEAANESRATNSPVVLKA